jgi:histidinol-phosphate aminotransferase
MSDVPIFGLRALVHRRLTPLSAYAPKPGPPIKLDANESPYPLPPEARALLADALSRVDLNRYPDPRARRLRALLSERVGGAPEDLVIGTGSDEVICILMTALSEPRPRRSESVVLSVAPSFVMYRHNAIVCGQRPVTVPLGPGFALDVPALERAIEKEEPNLVFIACPNNPTGNTFSEESIEAIVLTAKRSLVVIDEAYAPFSGRSFAGLCDRHENVAIMGTLSKVGLAGARVGYCRLPKAIAGDVDKARQPFNLSALSVRAAELALTELAPFLDAQVARIVAERERLFVALGQRDDLEPQPSEANFVLVRVKGDAEALKAQLAGAGIAVRSFPGAPSLDGFIRITVGAPEENDALLAAL